MEDIDVTFSTQKRDLESSKQSNAVQQRVESRFNGLTNMSGAGQLSLSSILNAIDGVEANEGR